MRLVAVLWTCTWLAGACSSNGTQALDAGETAPAGEGIFEAWLLDAPGAVEGWRDARGSDSPLPDGPAGLVYKQARGVLHVHSVYSHDGCDSKGLVGGKPNKTCLKQLRDAACARKFDFVGLTDHPSYMSSYTMQEDLLYDATAGDLLVLEKGAPIANSVACTGGNRVLFSVGFESTHMMPLGLHALPSAQALYAGITDSTPLTQVKAQVQALQALGAVAGMVHSEETDISASTIVGGSFEAMELYNIHGNIAALIGSDKLSASASSVLQMITLVNKLLGFTDFLSASAGAPNSDLVYLMFLDVMPKQGFAKWRTAMQTQSITGILGSDIHQNVTIDQTMCAGVLGLACAAALGLVESALGLTLPQALKTLILSGGSITLGDGDRIDSYGRLMRWLENRVLVQTIDQLSIQASLRAGRVLGVLTVFGDPYGFSFTGQSSGTLLQLGDSAKAPVTLVVSAPSEPVPITGGASFTKSDAQQAEVRTRLLLTDKTQTALVKEVTALGATINLQVSQPGAYHVEVLVKPRHLTTALGTSQALASKEYLWIITNPIVVTK